MESRMSEYEFAGLRIRPQYFLRRKSHCERSPLRLSSGSFRREGIGEGSPSDFSGERAKEMASVVEGVFAPLLIGMCPFDLEAIG